MKILVITSRFGQEGMPASIHIDDRISELINNDIDITLITESKPNYLRTEFLDKISVHVINYSHPTIYKFLEKINLLILYKIARKAYYEVKIFLNNFGFNLARFANWGWEKSTTKYILKCINLLDYDLIYSTGGHAVAHLVACNVKRKTNKKWIAEIQDPLIFDEMTGISYRATKVDLHKLNLTEQKFKEADALICLTKYCMNHYQNKLDKNNVFYLYPGSNIKIASMGKKNNDKLTMLHTGTLSGERNLNILIEAIKKLGIQDKINIKIAGKLDKNVTDSIIRNSDFITNLGLLPRTEVFKHVFESDLCLVIQNTNTISTYTIPSKFYEYCAMNSPVLFLGYKNEEVRENSKKYNFYYADQSSIQEVMEVLSQIINSYPNEIKVTQSINYYEITNKFLEVCRNILNCE